MVDFDKRVRLDGFLAVDEVLTQADLLDLMPKIDEAAPDAVGDRRMLDHVWCRELSRQILTTCAGRGLVTGDFVGVLCTFFDKSARSNWIVAPHRDLAVPVRVKADIEGWRNWSVKQDIPHAQPPRSLLERMFSLRLNVDPSTAEKGALKVSPGSHVAGHDTIPDRVIEGRAGDGLLMSPLTVHASKKSASGASRRVLHFLYGPRDIGHPAEWFYAV